MTNYRLINEAVKLANMQLESNGIMETNKTLFKRALVWYNNTEITDAETLAAVTLSGHFHSSVRYNDIIAIKEFYFPTVPVEYTEIPIWEIEAAQHDAMWW